MKIDLKRAVEVLEACGYECEQLASRDAEIATLYATVQQAHDALQRLWDESNLEPIPYVQEALAATEPTKEIPE